jgi:hypothetical protein
MTLPDFSTVELVDDELPSKNFSQISAMVVVNVDFRWDRKI